MYQMKQIITHDEQITLPKCMYHIRNPNDCLKSEDIDIKISEQVIAFLKNPNRNMSELEERQNQLLRKLDILYDRIKVISSYCNNVKEEVKCPQPKNEMPAPEEIVISVSPDNLPWFINVLNGLSLNIAWHIHSSVSNEKVPKVQAFLKNMKKSHSHSKVNIRLIFKVTTDAELKLSSLVVPILGNVNMLRYLAYVFPTVIPYDCNDYYVDSLLDLCHILERTPEKNKEALLKNIFSQYKNSWIYKDQFSIVDIAVYNIIKQGQNSAKYVPKNWLEKFEKLCKAQ